MNGGTFFLFQSMEDLKINIFSNKNYTLCINYNILIINKK